VFPVKSTTYGHKKDDPVAKLKQFEDALPTPMIDEIKCGSFGAFGIDNSVSDLLKEVGFAHGVARLGCSKRSGRDIPVLIMLMILRPLLHVNSIFMFCRGHYLSVFNTGKDAFYRILQHPVPWRSIHWSLVKRLVPLWRQKDVGEGYLVADTTVVAKRGKEIEGACWHHDHTTGRSTAGFETTQLVWINNAGCLVLDAALRLSKKPLIADLSDRLGARFDGRSLLGKRVKESADHTKLDHTLAMVKRAVDAGIPAKYFLADAWFDSLGFLSDVRELGLIPLVRMKRGNTKFWYDNKEYDVKELWAGFAKAKTRKVIRSLKFKGTHLDVFHPELGLVRLFFMHLIDPAKGSKEWAVFITTDTSMAISAMVEHYANRFGIEVFYKESKQYLGFMKESVRSFEAVTACLHIAAMRHAVLSSLAVLKGVKREEVSNGVAALSYAQKLWNVFRLLIAKAIHGIENIGSDVKEQILETVNQAVDTWLRSALLMDVSGSRRQILAESNCES
jgi:hypothetical protein